MKNFCSENQLLLLPTTPFQVFIDFVLWLFHFPFNRLSLSFNPFHIFVMYKRHGHANLTLEHFLKIAFAVKLLGYMDKSRGDGTRCNFSFLRADISSSSSPNSCCSTPIAFSFSLLFNSAFKKIFQWIFMKIFGGIKQIFFNSASNSLRSASAWKSRRIS